MMGIVTIISFFVVEEKSLDVNGWIQATFLLHIILTNDNNMRNRILAWMMIFIGGLLLLSCNGGSGENVPSPLISPYTDCDSNDNCQPSKEICSDNDDSILIFKYDEKYKAIEQDKEKMYHEKIGIVFGGGGAKAAAEIGVLKTIEKAGLRVDYVAGSSMGAVIGGLYAAGYSAREIEGLWMTEEWISLFDRNQIGVTVEDNERTIFGLIKGDIFEEKLRDVLAQKGCFLIEDTKKRTGIEFCCTATNIIEKKSLEEEDLSSGDMAKAIRASLTYPAPIVGYKPVQYNGKNLVDGGMLNNLPVDVAKIMGAEKVIAIDLETRRRNNRKTSLNLSQLLKMFRGKIPYESILGIHWLLDWLASHPDINKHNQNYEDADIKIHPDLLGYGILDFNERDFKEMIELGEDATRECWDDIMALNG